ncbi:UDP-4-amino-4,6-dideoxy-N-acetyl-beta-L-altrosamine transaminase [Pseudoalteromonas viridis]|uniref:UDP-4-amino-4, 6-dideoxy-N-acetyl-beta-L-altrosamine transaminase n=1 Tax=Pseudoalteromonas viridis TaxID=339617 RepID=A0ABX7V6S2_9GAMM|nr:UDP-4-amino-4,6-dideoxy-N-acetyl-beta-L-altrosamine transaminase [Pseudoalteromonas viridis]QTL34234.1 UDP-4-amino-4,6-dideoxy-N-acetyl-beta-L-altrosamine transaminase [Pseudoalteromonas viridis]
MIPYGRQCIDEDDISAVVDVLKSNWLTQGPKVPEFEEKVAGYTGAAWAIACSNATAALHLSCLALGVGAGDFVWTSPVSFVASANCALYCGARVDFVDIEVETGNMSVAALEHKLALAKLHGKLPKVVIPVHLAGQSCDMQRIYKLSQEYGFKIIEDASHAIGGRYQERPIGSGQYSDICVFSFHPVKIVTTGEGGLMTTNCERLAEKIRQLRSHGVVSQENQFTEQSHGPWYYEQQALGFNYRMTDIQAALGITQMDRLDTFVAQRNTLAKRYSEQLPTSKVKHLTQSGECYSSYHLYIVQLEPHLRDKQKAIITELRQLGIVAHLHYIPIHLQPYYQGLGFKRGDFPAAEEYYSRAITLPLHPQLSQTELCLILKELKARL